ncbi:polysaccharide lyase 8 family protein [Paenibacillus sp. GYB003]|uniref:polysaccharide lyase 8 family protein n=1 Tax=Paenibacillus sp. GYB003 TaxID=2994392 RepID=UPI002F963DAA
MKHLREKWKRILLGGPELDARDPQIAARIERIAASASAFWTSMNKSPDRDYIWEDLASTSSSNVVTVAYIRIKEMAIAYALRGSALHNNTALKTDILDALEWMYANRYRDGMNRYSNWWHWEIGAPLALTDAVILLYESIPADRIAAYMRAVDHFSPNPDNYTGANRIWVCLVVALRSIVLDDSDMLAAARDAVSPVFPYVRTGDGFYADGSFIQHGHFAYTGSYGRSMLLDMSKLLYLLNGTEWEVVDPLRDHVFRWVFDSFEPVMYRGALMDFVRGREIARYYSQEHDSGQHVIEAVMRLARIAPAEDAERMRRMAKHWILTDDYMTFGDYATVPFGMATSLESVALAKELLQDGRLQPRDGYAKFKMFAAMDRAVHHRDRFAFAIAMFSSRIASYESINGENLKGWHTAHGAVYLYNGDLGQFADGYWPTVDPYRLPGTTVTTAARDNGFGRSRLSSKSWIGGVELLDRYGAVGMELEDYRASPDDERCMTAKKSWFLFDEEIVALGSDIRTEQPVSVETIVDNRKLNEKGDNRLIVNGRPMPAAPGWAEELPETGWMHVAGDDERSGIGYYFPGTPALRALREARTGRWSDINDGEANELNDSAAVTRNYLTVWFDHGVSPKRGTYAYVLLPGQSADRTAAYTADPSIEIVEQSSAAHAVHHKRLNVWGVHFWNDEAKKVGPIASDRKAAVMLKAGDGEIDLAVADPTQQGVSPIAIEIAAAATEVLYADPGIEVKRLEPSVILSVDVAHAGGRTRSAKLRGTLV